MPNALSDKDQVGYTFRQALTNYPFGDSTVDLPGPLPEVTTPGEAEAPMAGYSGIQSNGKIGNGTAPSDGSVTYQSGEFAPYKTPDRLRPDLRPDRAEPARPGLRRLPARPDRVSAGRERRDHAARARQPSNPAIATPDYPGSRGPTTLYWGQDFRAVPA